MFFEPESYFLKDLSLIHFLSSFTDRTTKSGGIDQPDQLPWFYL